MSRLAAILNSFAMVPYAMTGVFRDGDRPHDIFLHGADPHTKLPRKTKALLVASDTSLKIRRTRQFLDPADRIYDALVPIVSTENITYIQGDAAAREHLGPELEALAESEDAKKFFIYIGHGSRKHPYFGTGAMNTFLTSEDFLNMISDDDSPWIAIFDNCFSGSFAQNVSVRSNTLAISTNTERTGKPCVTFLPRLFEELVSGKDLMSAFIDTSHDHHDNSFDYLLAAKPIPQWALLQLRKIDDGLRISSAAKQLYSNGIDPSRVYLNGENPAQNYTR